jgi:hypothetical protein
MAGFNPAIHRVRVGERKESSRRMDMRRMDGRLTAAHDGSI